MIAETARRRRIGLVCPYALHTPGGVQNHVLGLAGWLTRRGHDVSILAPGLPTLDNVARHGLQISQFTSLGRAIPIRWNGSVARIALSPLSVIRVRRWLRRHAHDVLHLHEPLNPSGSLPAWLLARATTIATFHASGPRSWAVVAMGRVLRGRLQRLGRIAVSQAAREVVARDLGSDAEVIGNGIDSADFHRPGVQRQARRVVAIGRLGEPRKGLSVLLRAWPMILSVAPAAELVLAGAHRWRLRPEHDPSITVLGVITDDERADLLSSAAVFVAPQTGRESFGLVIVEALAAGARVVASDLPAFGEVIGELGFGHLFEAGNPWALADAVLAAFADADAEPDAGAAASVAPRFDWAVIGPQLVRHYGLG